MGKKDVCADYNIKMTPSISTTRASTGIFKHLHTTVLERSTTRVIHICQNVFDMAVVRGRAADESRKVI